MSNRKFRKLISSLLISFILLWSIPLQGQDLKYVIQGGDSISIEVMDHPEFTRGFTVRPDGMISFPLLGDITVMGLTCGEVTEMLTARLDPYVKESPVTVNVTGFFFNRAYLLGGVNSPGAVTIFEGVDIIKFLNMAGGCLDEKPKKAKIFRTSGEMEMVHLSDFWKAEEGSHEELRIYPGDAVFVYENFKWKWVWIWYFVGTIGAISSTLHFMDYMDTR